MNFALGFTVLNNTHFLDSSFRHVDGSACCVPTVNTTPASTFDDCLSRCYQPNCSTIVFQPSTGLCWLGSESPSGTGLVPVPARDRISAISPYTSTGTLLLPEKSQTGRLLSEVQPRGVGVILGVGTGEFATSILEQWDGVLYLVDPYIHIWSGYEDPSNLDDKTHQLVFETLREQLHNRFEHKHVLVRDFSFSFGQRWTESAMLAPTFIYIDNNHSLDAVTRDLIVWWELLAPGGIVSGSNYFDDTRIGVAVRTAVDNFFERKATVYLSDEKAGHADWLVFKPFG